jgi:choice-of-anchor B domain-containing protein
VIASGLVGLPSAAGQFDSNNVALHSWIDLNTLGAASGNDCWGYVSASGREYALMGVSNKLAVVEITNPASPVIVGTVSHTDTLWGDMKTYGDFAYVVNDNGGGGMDVVDLSDVDNGNVRLEQRVTAGGLSTSHNVAIDTDSGYLYLCGANLNGGRLIAYSLADPADPTFAGQVSQDQGTYVHDAQIVTYTTGPYAGRQIAFCANGGTGLDIYDVTSKANMFRLSRTAYPNLSYAHQCWLSEDRLYLYLNDELDSVNETVIFDVTNLSTPAVAGTSSSGVQATDHNLFVRDGFIYEAEYHAGVRIFCADDPVNPVQVGWFDTYPENDGGGFDGAWSVYPYFPSGTLLVSDIDRGLFILDPSDALEVGSLDFAYPNGRPDFIDPAGGTSVRVEVTGACGASAAPGTGLLHYDAGDGFVTVPMNEVSENVYDAIFPAVECTGVVSYYVSAENSAGGTATDPPGAPGTTYSAVAADGEIVVLEDDFETDQGWTVQDLGGLTTGTWERGIPAGGGDRGDPADDADGSGQCYVTGIADGDNDIDDGTTTLTSPVMDASDPNSVLTYYRWYSNTTGADPENDAFVVEVTDDDGSTWENLETVGPSGPEVGGGWFLKEFRVADIPNISNTSQFRVRFSASDLNSPSVVEAGVDGFKLSRIECEETIPGDLDGDGSVGISDLLMLLAAWGPCPDPPDPCPGDLDGDGSVGIGDLLILLANWG